MKGARAAPQTGYNPRRCGANESHRAGGVVACSREAARLDPKAALPRNDLGVALALKGELDGAAGVSRRRPRP